MGDMYSETIPLSNTNVGKRLDVYMVRFDTSEGYGFGGRMKIHVKKFTDIPMVIAEVRQLDVESIVIESAVLIERKFQ